MCGGGTHKKTLIRRGRRPTSAFVAFDDIGTAIQTAYAVPTFTPSGAATSIDFRATGGTLRGVFSNVSADLQIRRGRGRPERPEHYGQGPGGPMRGDQLVAKVDFMRPHTCAWRSVAVGRLRGRVRSGTQARGLQRAGRLDGARKLARRPPAAKSYDGHPRTSRHSRTRTKAERGLQLVPAAKAGHGGAVHPWLPSKKEAGEEDALGLPRTPENKARSDS